MASILSEPVLKLNKGWNPIDTTTVRDALSDVFAETAKIINPEDCSLHDFMSWAELPPIEGAPVLATAWMYIRLPEVIVLTESDGKIGRKRDIVPYSRRNVFKRDSHTCQYCGGSKTLTLDHVFPRSRGGKSNWTNVITSCFDCNLAKKDRTPEEAGMKLRNYRPFEPRWSPIFKVSVSKYKPSWKQFVSESAFSN